MKLFSIIISFIFFSVSLFAGDSELELISESNIEFSTTNTGIVGFDSSMPYQGNVLWPRGSANQYIYGGGIWFGTRKFISDTSSVPSKLVVVSYNPNSGKSWFGPGAVEDQDNQNNTQHIYNSTKFNRNDGTPITDDEFTNWPYWIINPDEKLFLGNSEHKYEYDANMRNTEAYPDGPLFVSNQDLVTVCNDSDLNNYEQGQAKATASGYPLGLEIEQSIYSWNSGKFKDAIIIVYNVRNTSADTLYESSFGFMADIDLGRKPYLSQGASNDRVKYCYQDPSLNMGYAWTNSDRGEYGYGFGYMGISLIETPTVKEPVDMYESNGWLNHDQLIFSSDEQLGIESFPNWNIADDKTNDADKYNYMRLGVLDGDNGPGDKRVLAATGGFHLCPNESFRVAVGITFAMPVSGEEATGEEDDIENLVQLNRDLKAKYYDFYASILVDERLKSSKTLPVYPNPANEFINMPTSFTTPTYFEIYDINGVSVKTGETKSKINIAELSKGAYLLFVDGESYKFVKE